MNKQDNNFDIPASVDMQTSADIHGFIDIHGFVDIHGYVDIHAHILPGVDDGPCNMEQTISMLHMAHMEQITTIIATPHYMAGANNSTVGYLTDLKDRVQEEAYKIDKSFRILLGNELYYSDSIVDALKSGEALSLAGSQYVLVEFSIDSDFSTIYRGISELIRHGYIPILAHAERYRALHRKLDKIEELIKMGCYIQMNSNSLLGGVFNLEARANRRLFNRGLVHFLSSDCHSDRRRVPIMKTALAILQKKCDNRLIEQVLLSNPTKVLDNTYI